MVQIQKEKQQHVLKAINAEQELQDVKRDIELKDVKIESLQTIIKKRGFNDTQRTDESASVNVLKQASQRLEVDLKAL